MEGNGNHTNLRPIVFSICAAQFILPFMMAGVNAVLPPLGASLGASARELGLVGTFYALALCIFQLSSGRMGDVWGRRRIFLLGMGIFAVCSLVQGFISDIKVFLALRFVQGMGAALFNGSGLAILAGAAPLEVRGRVIGLSGTAVYAGIACGPPVAGFVAGTFNWQWLFWGTSAAAAVCFALMALTVHEEWRVGEGEPYDFRGSFIYAAAMAALVIGATELQDSLALGFVLIGVGALFMVFYVLVELRTNFPLLDVRLLVNNKVFGLSSLAAFINYSSTFGMLFFFSLYLQVAKGMNVRDAGLFLILQSIIQVIFTPLASRLAEKYTSERVSAFGIALCGLGLLSAIFMDAQSSLWYMACAQVMLGLGISFFATPNTTVMLGSVDSRYLGQASGLVGAVRTGGAVFNMAIITMTLGFFLGHEPVGANNVHQFIRSMHFDLALFGVLNLLAIGCAMGRGRIK